MVRVIIRVSNLDVLNIDVDLKQVWSTNRCVLSNLFFKFEDRQMDQETCLPVEIQIYISVMFLGLPDDIHEEKNLYFCNLKKSA